MYWKPTRSKSARTAFSSIPIVRRVAGNNDDRTILFGTGFARFRGAGSIVIGMRLPRRGFISQSRASAAPPWGTGHHKPLPRRGFITKGQFLDETPFGVRNALAPVPRAALRLPW